jgi:hypothetical protein
MELAGSCAMCTTDSECASNRCQTFTDVPGADVTKVCAETADGLMSDGCFCHPNANTECSSGRCEVDEASGLLWLCVPTLDVCGECDEDSDCQSGMCLESGFCAFVTGALPPDGCVKDDTDIGGGGGTVESCEPCVTNTDCMSGFCRTLGEVRHPQIRYIHVCFRLSMQSQSNRPHVVHSIFSLFPLQLYTYIGEPLCRNLGRTHVSWMLL